MANSYNITERDIALHQAKHGRRNTQRGGAGVAREKAKKEQVRLIKQSSKGPNKIEAAFEMSLYWRKLRGELVDYYEHETIPLKLANGLLFKPDYPAIEINPAGGVRLVFYEVKGYQRNGKTKPNDDAVAKIKTAAAKFRHFRFVLVWREGEEWREQEVLP